MEWRIDSLEQLDEIADFIIGEWSEHRIVCFSGEMGSGKTTLIKRICQRAGVQEEVSSPTFALVNQYDLESGMSIFHFDLYRVEKEDELLDFGFEEYLDSGHPCLIEWPAVAAPYLPATRINVSLRLEGQARIISVQKSLSDS